MFLQVMTKGSDRNPHETDGTVKDPKNPNSVALLLVAVTPAALPLLQARDPMTMVTLAIPLVFAALAVWLLIAGLAAQDTYKSSDAAPRPKVPCKILGCAALGLTMGALVMVHTSAELPVAVTQGALAMGLALLAFGLDPLKDKGLETSTDRARLAAKANAAEIQLRLDTILESVRGLGQDDAIEATVDVADAITRLTTAVTLDPVRHRIARRHLGPMLDGVEDGTRRFVSLWTITPDPKALAEFLNLADDVSVEYDRAAESYARAGAVDLEVEASVLRDLIKREAA